MTRPLYCDESIWIPVADGLSRHGGVFTPRKTKGRWENPTENSSCTRSNAAGCY